jgi:RNA-binding protein
MSDHLPLLPAVERRALQARAHLLRPVVIVGSKGLTDAVLKEVDVALRSHELIKIKLTSSDRDERTAQLRHLSEAAAANPVQQIGKVVVLYRQRLEASEPAAASSPSTANRRRERTTGAAPRARSGRQPAARAPAKPDRRGKLPAAKQRVGKPRVPGLSRKPRSR